ncbi:MAG TPA: hypothetical protein EYP17_05295 [Candidatus Latescibacteria bacterium]|nr:hypothetical protein [Candidatus Latescibacterota bacterium]
MLTDRIRALKEEIVFRVLRDGEMVELGQVRRRGAPPSVVRRLAELVEALLKEERARRAQSPLNYEHPKVQSLLGQLDELLEEVATFPKEKVERLVEEYIQWEIWIRIAPSEMAPKVIFRGRERVSGEEALRAVQRMPLEEVYEKGLRKLLDGIGEVGQEELGSLFRRVEREALDRDPVEFLMGGVASLMELFLGREVQEEDQVDLDVLEHLLRGRGMEEWARLIRVQRALGHTEWTLSQVRRVLEMSYRMEEGPPEEMVPIGVEELVGPRREETPVSLPSLRELIGRKGRYFVRKLFGKDKEVFEAVVDHLEPIADVQQAERELEECWRIYGLDRNSKAAMEFRDIVLARYR